VARHLAAALAYDCLDADDAIEASAGKSITEIFADAGEAGFRELETRVVADLCRSTHVVIALGGGAVLRDENRLAIRAAAGPVVWLTALPQTLHRRIIGDTSTSSRRPNLTAAGGLDEIERLLQVRLPYYRECATLEVDTEGKTPAQVAQEIAVRLQLAEHGS
jgi:shikimate kinase